MALVILALFFECCIFILIWKRSGNSSFSFVTCKISHPLLNSERHSLLHFVHRSKNPRSENVISRKNRIVKPLCLKVWIHLHVMLVLQKLASSTYRDTIQPMGSEPKILADRKIMQTWNSRQEFLMNRIYDFLKVHLFAWLAWFFARETIWLYLC